MAPGICFSATCRFITARMLVRRALARPTSSGATTGGSLSYLPDATLATLVGWAKGMADRASRTIRRETNRRLIIPPEESPRRIGANRWSGCCDDSMFDVLAGVIQRRRAQQRQDDRRSGPQIQLRMIIAARHGTGRGSDRAPLT